MQERWFDSISKTLIFFLLTGCDQQISEFIGSSSRNRGTDGNSNFQISNSIQVYESETATVSFKASGLKATQEFIYEIAPVSAVPGINYDVSGGVQGQFSLSSGGLEKTLTIPILDNALKEAESKEFKITWKKKSSGQSDLVVGTSTITILPRSDLKAFDLFNKGLKAPSMMFDAGTYILYGFDDGVNGLEIWRTNGTTPGTFLLKDVCPGVCSGFISDFVQVGGFIFFTGSTDGSTIEIWKTDGTTLGTTLAFTAANMANTWGSPSPADESFLEMWTDDFNEKFYIYKYGTKLALATTNFSVMPYQSLIVSDGTIPGTERIINTNTSSTIFAVKQVGSTLFSSTTEMWASNGTLAGTTRVTSGIGWGAFLTSPLVAIGSNVVGVFGVGGNSFITRSDGTVGGTVQYTTTRSNWFNAAKLIAVGNYVFFTPFGAPNPQLHAAPPTGTVSNQILSLPAGTTISLFGSAGNNALIMTSVLSTGILSLYVSDGTTVGTQKVLDFPTAGTPGIRTVSKVFNANSKTLFAVDSDFWLSDGTVGGTNLASGFFSPLGLTNLNPVLVHSGYLYFWANHATYGRELWKTDFTNPNTVLVWDSYPGVLDSKMNYIGTFMNSLWFSQAVASGSGTEVYRFDLTSNLSSNATFTFPYLESFLGTSANHLSYGVSSGTSGYFVASENGPESRNFLYQVNPTTFSLQNLGDLGFGTVSVAQLGTNIFYGLSCSACPSQTAKMAILNTQTNVLTKLNVAMTGTGLAQTSNKYIFKGFTTNEGNEPWVTNGTLGGTSILLDITAGSAGTNFILGEVGTSALIGTTTALYASDGTPGGTIAINPSAFTVGPTEFLKFGNKVVFAATTAAAGRELWITNGTLAGTSMIKDIGPTTASGIGVSDLIYVIGNQFLFFANDGTNGAELWISDGTGPNTTMLKDINSSAASSIVTGVKIAILDSKMIFEANNSVNGKEWWVSDGTVPGTQMLADLCVGACSSTFSNIAIFNSKAYYWQVLAGVSKILTVTDGTPSGTQVVHDLGTSKMKNTGFSTAAFMTASSRYLYFPVESAGETTAKLWRSDGVTTEIVPGNSGNHTPENPIAIGKRIGVIQKNGLTNYLMILK